MKIAIFSDVHGNLTALEAVLKELDTLDPQPDQVYFAGDFSLFGPRPDECVTAIRERDMACIYGNTDQWIQQPPLAPADGDDQARQRWQWIAELCRWTESRMSLSNLLWLETLPFHCRTSPSVNPRDDVLIVHANPKNVDDVIHPAEDDQKRLYGKVEQRDEDLAPLLEDVLAGVIAFGHLHRPSIRPWGDLLLVNVSSVSRPLDEDPRAKYALLTWKEEDGWSIEHRPVSYSFENEIEAYRAARPPGWEAEVETLRQLAGRLASLAPSTSPAVASGSESDEEE